MIVTRNELDGLWAVPTYHPTTCANPAPWKITEMKIGANPLKIWIRGEGSMWFRADQCFIHTQEECLEYQKIYRPNDVGCIK